MKYLFNSLSVLVFFLLSSINACATKIAPVSLEELLNDSPMIVVVDVLQASLSTNKYRVVHSGEEKKHLDFVAIVIDPIKGSDTGKTIKFSSREPLFVGRKYLVFLNPLKTGDLFVAQAGFAAFEKTYISFAEGVKGGVRVPSNYISLSKDMPSVPGVTKLNEQSSYVWAEFQPFKKWVVSRLGS